MQLRERIEQGDECGESIATRNGLDLDASTLVSANELLESAGCEWAKVTNGSRLVRSAWAIVFVVVGIAVAACGDDGNQASEAETAASEPADGTDASTQPARAETSTTATGERSALSAEVLAAIEDARERWESTGIDEYTIRVEVVPALGPDEQVIIGSVTPSGSSMRFEATGEPVPEDRALSDVSVDGLFLLLDTSIEKNAELSAAMRSDTPPRLHPDLGYPTNVWIDYDPDAEGDEIGITVLDLEPDETTLE